MATNEEKREKGFIDADVYGIDESDIHRYFMENRLIVRKVYNNLEDVVYSKDRTPIVLVGDIDDYWLYKIGVKREILGREIPEWIKEFSRKEREYQKEFNRRGRSAKGEKGGYLGGYVPYGYYSVNKKLYIDDYESFVVKFVYYRYSQGCSLSGIAKELNLRGFRNRNDREFATASISCIIKNERFYQGYTTFEGKEIKGDYKGILEDTKELLTEEWKKRVFDSAAEARIAKHRERSHSENSVPHEIKPYIVVDTKPKNKRRRDVWNL